jgi:hypothetical protein
MEKRKLKKKSEGAQRCSLRSQELFVCSLRSHLRALVESAILEQVYEQVPELRTRSFPLKGKSSAEAEIPHALK